MLSLPMNVVLTLTLPEVEDNGGSVMLKPTTASKLNETYDRIPIIVSFNIGYSTSS